MRRGEVWVASFRPWRGREVGMTRPCVVIQTDWLTDTNSTTVLVLPLTTQLRSGGEHLRVPMEPRDRLRLRSYVMVDKMRAVDRRRFGDGPITRLTREERTAVEQSLKGVLGLL